jgi:hypothetical protein
VCNERGVCSGRGAMVQPRLGSVFVFICCMASADVASWCGLSVPIDTGATLALIGTV